jgi:hypothetical protein
MDQGCGLLESGMDNDARIDRTDALLQIGQLVNKYAFATGRVYTRAEHEKGDEWIDMEVCTSMSTSDVTIPGTSHGGRCTICT